MIKKVAESQCWRSAYQGIFAGTYDESEKWPEPAPKPIRAPEPTAPEKWPEPPKPPAENAIEQLEELLDTVDHCDDPQAKLIKITDRWISGFEEGRIEKSDYERGAELIANAKVALDDSNRQGLKKSIHGDDGTIGLHRDEDRSTSNQVEGDKLWQQ